MITSSAGRRHRHPVIMRPTSHGSLARAHSGALRAICLLRRAGTKNGKTAKYYSNCRP